MPPSRQPLLDQLGLTRLAPRNTPFSGNLQDLVPPNRMALQEGAGAVDSQLVDPQAAEIPLSQQTREISPDVSSQVGEISRQMSYAQVQRMDWKATNFGMTEGDQSLFGVNLRAADDLADWGAASGVENETYDQWVRDRNSGALYPEIPFDPKVIGDPDTYTATDNKDPHGGVMVRAPMAQGLIEGGRKSIGRQMFAVSRVIGPVIATIGESMLDATTRKEVSEEFPREEIFDNLQDHPRWQALAPSDKNNFEKLGYDALNILPYFYGGSAVRGVGALARSGIKAVTTPGTTLPAAGAVARTAGEVGRNIWGRIPDKVTGAVEQQAQKAFDGITNIYRVGAEKTIRLGGDLSFSAALNRVAQLYNRIPSQVRGPLESVGRGIDRFGRSLGRGVESGVRTAAPSVVRQGQRLATGKAIQNIGYMGSEGFSDAMLTAAQGGGAREVYNAMLLGTFGGPIVGGLIGKVGSLASVPVVRKYMNWLLPEAALHHALDVAGAARQSAVKMTSKVDEAGNIVRGADGKPIMVEWRDPITGQTAPTKAHLDDTDLPEGAKPGLLQQGGLLEGTMFDLGSYFRPDRATVVSKWFNAGTEHARKLRDFMKQGFDFKNGWGIMGFIGKRTEELDFMLQGVLRRTDLPQGEALANMMPQAKQAFGVIQDVWKKFADEPFMRQGLDPDTGEFFIPPGSQPLSQIAKRLHKLVADLSFPMTAEDVGRTLGGRLRDKVEAGTAIVPNPALEVGFNIDALTVENIYEMRRLLDELGNFNMLQTGKKPIIDLGPQMIERMRGAAGVFRKVIEKAAPDTKGILADLSRYLEVRDGITEYLLKRGNSGDVALASGQNLMVGALANNRTRMWGGAVQGPWGADNLNKMVAIGETYMKGVSLITAGAQSFAYYNNKEAIMTGTASAPWDLVTTFARHYWASGGQTIRGQPNRPTVETLTQGNRPMAGDITGQDFTEQDLYKIQHPNYFLNPLIATLGPDDDSYLPTTQTGRDQYRPGLMGGRGSTGYAGEANFWVDWMNSMIGMYKFTDRDGETEARELETPDQS